MTKFQFIWILFKIFELTEVMRQRGDSQLIDLLNNVSTRDLQPDNINILKSRIIQQVQKAIHAMRFILLRKMQMPIDIMMKCWTQMKTNSFLKSNLHIAHHVVRDKIDKVLRK